MIIVKNGYAQTFADTSEHIRFLLFSFSFPAVDEADLYQLLSACLIASRIVYVGL